MVLSKRERLLVISTITVLALLVLDRYVLKSLLEVCEKTQIKSDLMTDEMNDVNRLIKKMPRLKKKWAAMMTAGLKDNESATESMVLHEIQRWSREYRMTLSSIKPDQIVVKQKEDFNEITFMVTAMGSLTSAGQFLYELEHTDLPVRLRDFQLNARNEEGNEMTLEMRMSAIFYSEKKDETQDDAAGPAIVDEIELGDA